MNSIKNFQRINTTSYIPYSERLYSPTINQNRLSTTNLIENNEKELIISNQRTKIYQLELKEKELEDLNKKYNELQKEFHDLMNYKISLEYEIKRKDNNYNSDISLLKVEKDEYQHKFNESSTNIKKLNAEIDYLRRENEIKKKEIDRLNKKINEINNKFKEISENNNILIKENKELYDFNLHHDDEMSKIVEDNTRLSKLYQDLSVKLENYERDKDHLTKVINEKNLNIDDLNNKINLQEENIKYLNKEIEDNDLLNKNIQQNYKDINIKIEELEKENAIMKENLGKEKNIRIEEENRNRELNNLLLNKENKIDELNKNYENILIKQRDLNDENSEIKIDIEKYKNNCKILREQNNNLMKELENIISFHEKVQEKLTRKDKIKELLNDNNNILQKSLINLDDILSKDIDTKSFL